MANNDFNENYGQVKRLYPDQNQLYFTLKGGRTAMSPTDGYYFIPTSYPNYKSLVDLVYLCAELGWTLQVDTNPALVGGHAQVRYLVVDR
jgi:hypothetical protein